MEKLVKKIPLVFYILLFTVMNFLYSSCKKTFQAEIPSYLHIEKTDLKIQNNLTQGSGSHKITDAWVFADDDLVGVYELPTTFPVLKQGIHSLKVIPGIKDNGIAASRVQYPFYEFYYNSSFTFYPDSIAEAVPVVTYYPSTKFAWIENFENPGITLDSVYPSSVKMNITGDLSQAFEGKFSGYAFLGSGKTIFKARSSSAFTLPTGGNVVYLELNYKTTVNLNIHLFSSNPGNNTEEFVSGIIPTNKSGTAEWNKIYINLTNRVSTNPNAADYRIIFYSDLSNEGLSAGEIYLDNIKLLHF